MASSVGGYFARSHACPCGRSPDVSRYPGISMFCGYVSFVLNGHHVWLWVLCAAGVQAGSECDVGHIC